MCKTITKKQLYILSLLFLARQMAAYGQDSAPPKVSDQARNAAIASGRDSSTTIPQIVSATTRDASASEVAVNWENVTLKDCIEVLCRDLGMEFIISPSVNVSQEVSVRAGDVTNWDREHKLELFDAVLDTAGVQRIQRGRVWVFAPSDVRPILRGFEESPYSDGKPIIGVIELKHVDAASATQFLNTVGGKPQRVYGMNGSQILMVMGTHAYLKQMEELVKLIDVSPSVMKAFTLMDADAEEMASELTNIFFRRAGGDGQPMRFVPINRLNMVVAHNAAPSTLHEIERWIHILDRSDEQNERVTKVYRMQVVEADAIAKTLSQLYSDLYRQTMERGASTKAATNAAAKSTGGSSKNSAKKNTTSTAPSTKKSSSKSSSKSSKSSSKSSGSSATATRAPSKSGASARVSPTSSSSTVDEEAIILSDKDTNTLIINAPADMHKDIERTINELDRARRQVLIETVLVEVTLDDSLDLGIEWAVSDSAGGISIDGKTVSSMGLQSGKQLGEVAYPFTGAASGLSYLIESSDKKMALIQAAETDDRLQVLSSPTVLTRDGMEAEISFGEEVPIQQSSVTDAGKENFSFDYRDAKITLKVTPHIDDFEMVTLSLEQTLRAVDPATADDAAPSFFTRELRSNLQVDNGQTLVLGGLIQRKDQKISNGIPFLNRIPYIGWLFGRHQTIKQGSEILMILTPRVVDTRDETDRLTEEFRNKILGAMNEKNIRDLYQLEDGPYPLPTVGEAVEDTPQERAIIMEDYFPTLNEEAE